jgi:hypothetical protein
MESFGYLSITRKKMAQSPIHGTHWSAKQREEREGAPALCTWAGGRGSWAGLLAHLHKGRQDRPALQASQRLKEHRRHIHFPLTISENWIFQSFKRILNTERWMTKTTQYK